MIDHDLILRATVFAEAAHCSIGQTRKYTGEPYIVHPRAVAKLVLPVAGDDSAMVAAALLHDVLEDTRVGINTLFDNFGADVTNLVEWLTDRTTPADGNRAARNLIKVAKLAEAPARAQTIKCADFIDNTKSIVEHDPKFAPVYLAEKRAALVKMRGADRRLWKRATELCMAA